MASVKYESEGARLIIEGDLKFDSVADVFRQCQGYQTINHYDLGAVERIDSAGAALLFWLSEHCRPAGGTAAMTGLSENARSLFRVSGFDHLISAQ